MSDDLTKAIAEALGCAATLNDDGDYRCAEHGDWIDENERCPEGTRIATALTPLIEARAVAAEASSLRKVARWLRDLGHDHLADVLDIKADRSLGDCPACGAKPGARCLTKNGKRRGRPHAARTNPKEKP